ARRFVPACRTDARLLPAPADQRQPCRRSEVPPDRGRDGGRAPAAALRPEDRRAAAHAARPAAPAGRGVPTQRSRAGRVWGRAGPGLAASGEDQFIRFCDLASGREVARTTEAGQGGRRLDYWAMAFSADSKELAAAGRDGVVRFIDPTTGQTKRTIPEPNTM